MTKNDLKYYEINADKWWSEGETLYLSNYLNQSRFEFFENYSLNWQGMKVLDVGCGGGAACEFAAKLGAQVSGIDLSPNSIKAAQDHAIKSNLKIDYQSGIAEKLPYDDNTFDMVLCFDVLEHVDDWNKVVSEVYRVLNKEGLFLFDTINKTFKSKVIMIWLLEDILKQLPKGLHDWNKFITPQELITNMENTGFRDIDGTNFQTLINMVFQGLNHQNKDNKFESFKIQINENTSVWYIGKAVKA